MLGSSVGGACESSQVLGEVCGDRSYVIKFETSMLPLSNFLIFTTYLLCLVDVFFNRLSAWHTYGNKLCSSSRRHVPLFVSGRLHTGASQEKRKEATPNLLFHVPLNNSRFGDFVDRIYLIELEIKDTTDTDRCASYLDLHLEIDSEGRLTLWLL